MASRVGSPRTRNNRARVGTATVVGGVASAAAGTGFTPRTDDGWCVAPKHTENRIDVHGSRFWRAAMAATVVGEARSNLWLRDEQTITR
jgi:hypothetical protein